MLIQQQISVNKNSYHSNGYLYPIEVLSAIEALHFKSKFEAVEAVYGHHLPYAGNLHHHFEWAYKLATHKSILASVRQFLGEEIGIMSTLMLTKYPQTKAHVDWHQDGHDSGWHPDHSITAWVARAARTRENGCMRVIPKSHKEVTYTHKSVENENNLTRSNYIIHWDKEPDNIKHIRLEAGQMSLHHNDIAHSSAQNESLTKRMGFIIRFGTPDFISEGKKVVLINPKKEYSHLQPIKCPKSPDLGDKTAINKLKSKLLTYKNR